MSKHADNSNGRPRGMDTRLAQGLSDPLDRHGFIHPPVYRGSTVLFPDVAAMRSRKQEYTYGTITPTTNELCNELNDLEGAAHTVLTPNGLSAITVPMLSCLSAGDHALVIDSCYAPTRRFCETILKRMGVEVDYYPPAIGGDITGWMKPNTKVVFAEAPSSNCFQMMDVPAVASAAHVANTDVVVMMDNTYATPLYFKPLDHGCDISIHALTKYPSGHSDLLLGACSMNARTAERVAETNNALGLCVGADEIQLVMRGLKTMGLRLRHQEASANHLANWLDGLNEVIRVMHPALPSDPGHEIWKRDFGGSCGLFSFVLNTEDPQKAAAFVDALQLFGLGYSWAGHESLVVLPDFSDRTCSAPTDGGTVVRLQIGLENVEDLQADIEQALSAAGLS
ncbi:MAG: cystathionine beta-lyase [Pseudomonadota bacterium]